MLANRVRIGVQGEDGVINIIVHTPDNMYGGEILYNFTGDFVGERNYPDSNFENSITVGTSSDSYEFETLKGVIKIKLTLRPYTHNIKFNGVKYTEYYSFEDDEEFIIYNLQDNGEITLIV